LRSAADSFFFRLSTLGPRISNMSTS
jgi:hypothetical protein